MRTGGGFCAGAIAEYLRGNGFEDLGHALAKATGIALAAPGGAGDSVLEKKWTAVVRLQKRAMELEAQVKQLEEELKSAPPCVSRRKGFRPSGSTMATAGDGLVGSFGLWMGTGASGWKVMAWEHRPYVFDQLRKNRPNTKIHKGRLTNWAGNFSKISPTAITVRGVREASGVCRGIRNQLIRPDWLGIWNPSRRPVWCRRLSKAGYQLELVWQNMEFYRLRSQ